MIKKWILFFRYGKCRKTREREHAENSGVTLIETPIALDAFIFIVNRANSVKSLTTKQIQNIYTGDVTNWNAVGGKDNTI
ncbi:MAG: substrate-binding domain-containing protein [Tannerella sp.]|nr:substrate-binding domain-containing protein [Tannerella sp.]